jgi:hypothetical protein
MQTAAHQTHISKRVSHNNCDECRADCERQFLREQWPGYRHVTDYREFIRALHRRITLKVETGRKQSPGYLSRLRQFPRSTEAAYLRRFAARRASTLN